MTASIYNLTFLKGGSFGDGGAIDDQASGQVNLEGDIFQDCVALENGGAIAMSGAGSRLNVSDCLFGLNWAGVVNLPIDATGGAISILGDNAVLNITASTFIGNDAIGGDANGVEGNAQGGAISLSGTGDTLTIGQDSSFKSNQALGQDGNSNGGAIAITSPQSAANSITDTTFEENTSNKNSGGAIYLNGTTTRLSIDESEFDENKAEMDGGAIQNVGANLSVQNTEFNGNEAQKAVGLRGGNGGAISSSRGTVALYSDEFNENIANDRGGAVSAVQTTLTVSWTDFTDNEASDEWAGGAISDGFGSSANVSYSNFQSNSVGGNGGAIVALSAASLTVNTDNFLDNEAISGGAIAIREAGNINFTGTIVGSFFQGNSAMGGLNNPGGGAINIFLNQQAGRNMTTTITNCTFFSNTTDRVGGALFVNCIAGTVSLVSLTITNNTGGVNGGVGAGGGVFVAPMTVAPSVGNSIIAGNLLGAGLAAANGPDVFGTVTSLGFNLIGNVMGSAGFGAGAGVNDRLGMAANLAAAPTNAVQSVRNGRVRPTSFTAVIPLQAGSPALGVGNPNAMQNGTTDQRGMVRAAATNIGAYDQNGVAPPPPAPPAPGGRMGLFNPGNQGPDLVGTFVNVSVPASNTQGDPLVYFAEGLPAGLSINDQGQITGQLYDTDASAQPYVVKITALDTVTGNVAKAMFDWTITNVIFNDSPFGTLQDAINAAEESGLPGAKITIAGTVVGGVSVTSSAVPLTIFGLNATITAPADSSSDPNGAIIDIENGATVSIEDVIIDGSTATGGNLAGINVDNGATLTSLLDSAIENINNSSANGVAINVGASDSSGSIYLSGDTFQNYDMAGVYDQAANDSATVLDSSFDSAGAEWGVAVLNNNNGDITIAGNTVDSIGNAIEVNAGSGTVTISGNTCTFNAVGILVESSGSLTISDNTVTGLGGSGGYGVAVTMTGGTAIISGNTVLGNDSDGIIVDLTSINTTTISGNTISGNLLGGLSVSDDGSGNTVTVSDNTISDNGGYGLTVSVSNNTLTISGNTISGNSAGVSLSVASSTLAFSDNTISGSTNDGVDAYFASSTITLSGDNEFYGNTGIDFCVSELIGSTITNTGTLNVNSDAANVYGLYVADGSGEVSVVNSGTLSVTANEGNACGICVGIGTGDASVANNGSLYVYYGDTGMGISVTVANGNVSVDNSGYIDIEPI